MDQNKVTELMKNEEFAKKVLSFENPKDVQAAFKAEGVDITEEEVDTLLGKFSDEELDAVAGGRRRKFDVPGSL